MSSDENRTIELSLLTTCPVACHYCPQDVLRSSTRTQGVHGSMTREALAAILPNAASGSTRGIRVSFAGFTEPYLHPKATDLVELCEASSAVREIAIFTTGEGLTAHDVERLGELRKLEKVTLHVDAFGAPQRERSNGVWPFVPLIVQKLPQARFTLLWDTVGSPEVLAVAQYLRQSGAEFTSRWPHSRAGNIIRLTRLGHRTTAVTCEKMRDVKAPVVLPGGMCVACCNDYGLTLPLGNLCDNRWEQLDFASVIRRQSDPTSGVICFQDCRWARPAESTTSPATLDVRGQRDKRATADVRGVEEGVRLNDVLSWTTSRREPGVLKVHVKWTPGAGEDRLRDGMAILASMLNRDAALESVGTIWLASWLVAEHPSIVEALGFTIVRAQHRGIGHAGMTREQLVGLYADGSNPRAASTVRAEGGR